MTLEEAQKIYDHFQLPANSRFDASGAYIPIYLAARSIVWAEGDKAEAALATELKLHRAAERCYEANRWGNRND